MSIKQYGLLLFILLYIVPTSSATLYTITPADDTYTAAIAGTPPGSNTYGDYNNIRVGRGTSINDFIGLWKFNNTIPYSEEVVNATFQVYVLGGGSTDYADSVRVFSELNNSWMEETVSNNSFSDNFPNGTIQDAMVISSTGVKNFSVSNYLSNIVERNATNFSFMLRPTTYETNKWTNFSSKEHPVWGYVTKVIVYTQARNYGLINVNLSSSNDAFTNMSSQSTNYGLLDYIRIGEEANGDHYTALFKFDTDDMFRSANHKQVKSAYLQLNVTGGIGGSNTLIVLNQNNDSWTEANVTYAFSPNYGTGSLINSSNVAGTGLHNFSVTSYVQGAYSYRDPHMTFEVRPAAFTTNKYVNVTSNNALINYPQLIIVYEGEGGATFNTTLTATLNGVQYPSHAEPFEANITQILNLTTNTTYDWYNISFRMGQEGIKFNGELRFGVPYVWGWGAPTISTTGTSGFTTDYSNNEKEKYVHLTVTGSTLIYNDFVNISIPNVVMQNFTMTPRDFQWAEEIDQRRISISIKNIGASLWSDYPINRSSSYVLNITSNRTSRLQVISPSTVVAGTPFDLLVVPFDRDFNTPTPAFTGIVNFSSTGNSYLPANYTYGLANRSTHRFSIMLNTTGIQYVNVTSYNGTFTSNPINVVTVMPAMRPLWYDVHGHSCVSDGLVNCIDEYYDIARNYSGLDVSATSDHDASYGYGVIVTNDTEWQTIGSYVTMNTIDNLFIAMQCYEFTSTDIGGHRNPCFLNTNETLRRVTDYAPANTQTTGFHTDYLADGIDMFATPHYYHSCCASSDNQLEYLREIISKFGIMESLWFNDLSSGYKVGAEGGGDSNTGAGRIAVADFSTSDLIKQGITAVYAKNFTRKGVFEAIKARRTYVTTEERMLLNFSINNHMMGEQISASAVNISVFVEGTNNLVNVSIIRNGTIIYNYTTSNRTASFNYIDSTFSGNKWYIVKVTQLGNGVSASGYDYAWTSPVWVSDYLYGQPVVYLTSSIKGYVGNSISLASSGSNITLSGSALSGGVDGSPAFASSRSSVMSGYKIFGITFIIIGLAGCLTSLMTLVGTLGGVKRR